MAILATAVAGLAYAVFWTMTTQVREVRAVVPFGDDPYDLFASIAIVLLPLVGGLTALRVARYGLDTIPDGPVAMRVGLGLTVCLDLVSVAVVATAIALVQAPLEAPSGIARLVVPGLAFTAIATLAAWVALGQAIVARPTPAAASPDEPEPDALDDLLTVLPLSGAVRGRIGIWVQRARHHRAVTGVGAALVAAIAAVVWHSVREGAWASPAAAFVYGGILVAILLVAYGVLAGPLRVLRPA